MPHFKWAKSYSSSSGFADIESEDCVFIGYYLYMFNLVQNFEDRMNIWPANHLRRLNYHAVTVPLYFVKICHPL